MKVSEIVDFLTLRNIEWQNVYAFRDGEPLWSDERIGRLYGPETLKLWQQHEKCPVHGCIVRDGKCSYEGCEHKRDAGVRALAVQVTQESRADDVRHTLDEQNKQHYINHGDGITHHVQTPGGAAMPVWSAL